MGGYEQDAPKANLPSEPPSHRVMFGPQHSPVRRLLSEETF
jgi:hypothetical protein